VNKRMAFWLIQRTVVVLAYLCVFSFAGPRITSAASQAEARPVAVKCVDMALHQIDTDKIVFGLKLVANAGQELNLDEVTLANLHFNGLPVFAAPLPGPIHLIKGQEVELPQAVLLTIYLHDVNSTKPLSQALQDGFATLDGELYVSVHLSLIAKLVLGSFQAVVPMRLQQKVAVSVPGGTLSKTAAVAVLEAADVAIKHLLAGVSATQGIWPGLRHEVLQQYAPATLAVAVTYSLTDMKGNEVPLTWSGVAFRVSPTRIVLTDEAMEPWSFDPEIAMAIQSGTYKLQPNTYKISLWSSGLAAPGPLTTDGGLQVGKQLHAAALPRQATTSVMMLANSHLPQKAKVDVRAGSNNIAFLTATEALPDIPTLRIAPDPPATPWQSVALLRFPRLGSDKLTPEVILTSAYLDHGRIRLGVNVDSSVFGSPIIAPGGIVGMVQDESSGIPWSEIAGSMKSSE